MSKNTSWNFLGGKVTLREAAVDQVIGKEKVSWSKGIVIEMGKTKIVVGRDFVNRLAEHLDEIERFAADVE